MVSEVVASAPNNRPPRKFSRFSAVDWGSVRGKFALTAIDNEKDNRKKGDGGGEVSRCIAEASSDLTI